MKVYQERWTARLQKVSSTKTLYRICLEIIRDDTGHTDMLAQVLANTVVKVIRKVIRLSH